MNKGTSIKIEKLRIFGLLRTISQWISFHFENNIIGNNISTRSYAPCCHPTELLKWLVIPVKSSQSKPSKIAIALDLSYRRAVRIEVERKFFGSNKSFQRCFLEVLCKFMLVAVLHMQIELHRISAPVKENWYSELKIFTTIQLAYQNFSFFSVARASAASLILQDKSDY